MKHLNQIKKTAQLKLQEKKKNTHISMSSEIRNTVLEGDNFVAKDVQLEDCELGRMTYIAYRSCFTKTRFGRYCSIGPDCKVIIGEHPTRKFVATSPAFFTREHSAVKSYVKKNKFAENRYTSKENKWSLEIGNDVWVGADVRMIEGIKIGDGAIICAGAVVTKDVPPYAIVGGVPAKIIRYRFTSEEIAWLLKLKWWKKEEAWIEKHAEAFEDIETLMKTVSE